MDKAREVVGLIMGRDVESEVVVHVRQKMSASGIFIGLVFWPSVSYACTSLLD